MISTSAKPCLSPPTAPCRAQISNRAQTSDRLEANDTQTETPAVPTRRALTLSAFAVPFLFTVPSTFRRDQSSILAHSLGAYCRDQSIYDFRPYIYGKPQSLEKYRGEVLVIVNVARLRTLRQKYGDKGFNLIAFPCNQFGGQAPGTNQEEREAAIKKFGLEFDVYDKIDVNGPTAHPLYKFLKQQQPVSLPETQFRRRDQGEIEWNYTKFLIDREGQPVRRYGSGFDPLDFEGDVDLIPIFWFNCAVGGPAIKWKERFAGGMFDRPRGREL